MPVTDKISFVDPNPDLVVSSLVAYYESLTGKRLQPAQVERIQINSIAYRISLMLSQINETANQCLIAFAMGSALEALAELMGVIRLPASAAQCLIRFQLVTGHASLTIPAGVRIQSVDGQVVFATIEDKSVLDTDDHADIKCECSKNGVIGNGYIANRIIVLLDPLPYISAVANIDETNGGGDDETDEALRERVRLAPSQFSVAGPKGAYKFWAKSAHPTIVDVAVTIGHDDIDPAIVIPGNVDIFPLLIDNATLTTEIRDAIFAICNDDKIRPLTDTVIIKSPVQLDYSIQVDLTILNDGISSDIIDDVTAKLQSYVDKRKNRLGLDVVRTQLIAISQANNVYSVNLVEPTADLEALESDFTNCTGITVNVVGTHDE